MTIPVTPDTLTLDMIEAYQRSVVRSLTASSREVDDVCRDVDWAVGGRGSTPLTGPMVVEARRRICAAINARAKEAK
jgi:hypothetical protein